MTVTPVDGGPASPVRVEAAPGAAELASVGGESAGRENCAHVWRPDGAA